MALRTRLDILAPVLILAPFQKAPNACCHRDVRRVLRYLRGTYHFGLNDTLGGADMIQAFLDADYAAGTVERKSTS